MKTKILTIILIAMLFLPAYGQCVDDSCKAVTAGELLFTLELADRYLNEPDIDNTLLYIDEPTRLRTMADEIEKKTNDLAYIKSVRVRLALYGIKGKNSK